jgi:phosphoribosylformylglycinamidine synthase
MAGGKGFDICTEKDIRNDAWLFGESQSRVLVSISSDKKAAFESTMQHAGVNATHIGTVQAKGLVVNGSSWGEVGDYSHPYNSTIANILGS